MTPEQIDQVFGRGRLKMVTGEHVEVYREAMGSGERRRYTKRFLATSDGDFGPWTEREWRILARLIGHGIRCVPDVVQFDGGAMGGVRLVQTYDAGVTVDQWATLLPVAREHTIHRHVFEDCAHWWALAHHCVVALDEIHALGLVHLDIKADNICVPYAPADFDPQSPRQRIQPVFHRLALIDFAFSLVSREPLSTPLPIGWQKDYDYQSPRLLRALESGRRGDLEPTRELDWRCDLYSLAAMLKRYLPSDDGAHASSDASGWTAQRYEDARALIYQLRDTHDREIGQWRSHRELIDYTGARLAEQDLASSLARGWTLARDAAIAGTATPITPITPMTRIARSIRVMGTVRTLAHAQSTAVTAIAGPVAIGVPLVEQSRAQAVPPVFDVPRTDAAMFDAPRADPALKPRRPLERSRRGRLATLLAAAVAAVAAIVAPSLVGEPGSAFDLMSALRSWFGEKAPPMSAAYRAAVPTSSAPAVAAPSVPAPEAMAETKPAALPETMPQVNPEPPLEPKPVAPPAPVATAPEPPEAEAAPIDMALRKGTTADGKSKARAAPVLPDAIERAPSNKRTTVANAAAPKVSAAPTAPMEAPPRVASARSATTWRAPPASLPPGAAATPSETNVVTRPLAATHEAIAATPEPREVAIVAAPAAPSDIAKEDRRFNMQANAAPTANVATGATQSAPPPAAKKPKSAPRPPRDDLISQLSTFFGWTRDASEAPAPIDERGVPSATSGTRGNGAARAPAASVTVPNVAPATTRPIAEAPPATVAPAAVTSPAPAMIPPPITPPPAAPISPWPRAPQEPPDMLVAQAKRMLVDTVPRVAAQAQPEVSRVLWTASLAGQPSQIATVVEAAYRPWSSDLAWIPASSVSPSAARRLHDDARVAATSGRNLSEALNLEMRAFAANPRDPEIASYLALLHLRTNPGQPEVARQLAMHAIAASGARRTARPEDWGTLAVASAMAGRESDAVRAYLVEIALSSNVDKSCQSALAAYTSFGDRLRVPVSAMLYRARLQSNAYESPSCTWPTSWTTVARLPARY